MPTRKFALGFAIIFIPLVCPADQKLPPNLAEKVNVLYGAMGNPGELKASLDSLNPQEKTAAISYLKEKLKDPADNPGASEVYLLSELGDDETIAEEAQTFPQASRGGGSGLGDAIQPKVIMYLAPNLYSNEPYVLSPSTDTIIEPKSFDAEWAIQRILANSPYFSKEVNDWAKSWRFAGDPTTAREAMRNWWNANKTYFSIGDYQSVKPGAPPPPESDSPSSSPPATPLPLMPAWTPTPALAPSTPTLTPIPVSPPTASIIPKLAVFIVAAMGLVAAGFWFFLRGAKP